MKDVSASHGEASLGELTLLQRGGGARGEKGRPRLAAALANPTIVAQKENAPS